jgi:RHS repeat-associated protein
MKINSPNKRQSRHLFIIICFLFTAMTALAQTEVKAPMTAPPLPGDYYSYTGITLSPGFSFTAAAGQSLRLYIQSSDCQPLATLPSTNQNYILTSVPRQPGYNPVNNYNTCDLMQTVQYFDGLGRPLQTVQVKGSPLGKDIVQPVAYDQFGREATKYLPYAATGMDGTYNPAAIADQLNFYHPAGTGYNVSQLGGGIAHIPTPYSVTAFEPSPLNRPVEEGAPGDAWQLTGTTNASGVAAGHTVRVDYATNNVTALTDPASYLAALYTISAIDAATQQRTLVKGIGTDVNYPAGRLYVTVTKDENWVSGKGGTAEEYKDNEGHVMLKRTFNTQSGALQVLSTYYVYDDLGNLAYVLPPQSNADNVLPAQSTLDALCYQYRYDERNRLTQKRVPGKGWEFIIYNTLDQVVATQDANQRNKASQEWTVSHYDAMGRVVLTGIYQYGATGADSRITVQGQAAANTTLWETPTGTAANYGYTTLSFPTSVSTTLTVNYYDDYRFAGSNPYPYPAGSSMTTGLPTGSLTNVLGTTNMLWSVIYYDDKGRNIETFKQHYLGGGTASPNNYDESTIGPNGYNFNDQLMASTRKHYTRNAGNTAAVLTVTVTNSYDYDHMGRKLNSWEQITNGTLAADTKILLAKNDYNEIGQLKGKKLHSADQGATFKQPITYTYNERGWLSKADAPLFEESLQYNTGLTQNTLTPGQQYNGNIAAQSWGTSAAPDTKTYIYQYDAVNRLTAGTSSNNYNESNIEYDLNGNINKLKRTTGSTTLTDDLQYIYTDASGVYTNQLQNITDITTSPLGQKPGSFAYVYDANGNLTTDNSKGFTGTTGITYNLLNLPLAIASQSTTYTYDASGQKLSRLIGTSKTDYIGGIQYEGTAGSSAISFIQTEEGRAIPNGATAYNYEYTLTDHLGDSRVNFDTGSGTANPVQTDNYYPFGMDIVVGNRPSPKNNYLYNKKELQENLGLYDYGARFYDPVIARWTTPDPLAEVSRRWSPYNYVMNNPIRNIDPDGMWTETADGFSSDSPEEAQAAFRQIQASEQNGSDKKKGDKKQHPESRTTAKRDGPSSNKPNAYQIALHTAIVLTAAQANQGFRFAPFKAGTSVSEFKSLNARGFVRVSTKGTTQVEGQWIMKGRDIEGLNPEQIQAKYSLPNTPDNISDVDIPNGTIMRSGIAGAAFGQKGGGVQYQLRGRASFGNTRLLEPVISPMENTIKTETVEPMEPIEPIEPIEPFIP